MSAEYRAAPRRRLDNPVDVIDAMTGERSACIIDISSTGIRVACRGPLVVDALYQWRFSLPELGGNTQIECGVHVLWVRRDKTTGENIAGTRYILIPAELRLRIERWCEARPEPIPRR